MTFTPMNRSISEQWLAEAEAQLEAEAAAERERLARMSPAELMQLRQQIEATKERGERGAPVRERLMGLRRTHFRETGSGGG